ncbi:MAG: argininosuccinate lyase, partial [Pseudomonadales bacterium]|nr:argininosuccinate lyase [Pseudomonadales bacterium]
MTANSTPKDQAKGLLRGRFSEATDAFVEAFTASVGFDHRLYREDIAGSKAHAQMLKTIDVLSTEECNTIQNALDQIEGEIKAGVFHWSIELEDVHMNIESRLIELIGDTGKKLHTGRSRNDQVATDIRLYLRAAIDDITVLATELQHAILDLAEGNADTIMPGFTHLQAAQPITFGHHLMAWYEMLNRDRQRLLDCRVRTNILPLGAAALAGTPYKPDREMVARLLGFDGVCQNSLDAVSDRDFAIEFTAAGALALTHMSRWCEEMVLWSSQQFNFV